MSNMCHIWVQVGTLLPGCLKWEWVSGFGRRTTTLLPYSLLFLVTSFPLRIWQWEVIRGEWNSGRKQTRIECLPQALSFSSVSSPLKFWTRQMKRPLSVLPWRLVQNSLIYSVLWILRYCFHLSPSCSILLPIQKVAEFQKILSENIIINYYYYLQKRKNVECLFH